MISGIIGVALALACVCVAIFAPWLIQIAGMFVALAVVILFPIFAFLSRKKRIDTRK